MDPVPYLSKRVPISTLANKDLIFRIMLSIRHSDYNNQILIINYSTYSK